MINDDQKMVR